METTKKTKRVYEVGEMLPLEMIKSTKGDNPIAKTEEGLICLIDRMCKGTYQLNSVWDCKVIRVNEKTLIVKPIELLVTAQANAHEAGIKAKKVFGQPQMREKFAKVKPNYAFKSKVELSKLEEEFNSDLVDAFNEDGKRNLGR